MAELTKVQKDFLDSYIRKHSILGKGKKKDADNFLRRLGKVEEQLDLIPTYCGDGLRKQLLQVDDKANRGDFSGAYHDLKKIKKDARKTVANFDPKIEAIELGHDIQLFFDRAETAVKALNIGIENARDQKIAFSVPMSVSMFLQTGQQEFDDLRSKVANFGMKFPNEAKPCATGLVEGMKKAQPLCASAGRFYTVPELLNRYSPIKADTKVAELDKQDRDLDRGELAKTTEKKAPNKREPEQFAMSSFTSGFKPKGGPKEMEEAAKKHLEQLLSVEGISPDIQFDLALKTEDDLFWEYASQKNYVSPFAMNMKNRAFLDPGKRTEIEAVVKGMTSAINEKNPNFVDFTKGTLKVGDTEYGDKTFLGKGGMGEVYKFTDPKDPTKQLVVKSVQSGDREEMEKELRAHWYLMMGDPKAQGRENVIEMKGLARDKNGNIHMIMELADAGDMNGTKHAMTEASKQGGLSEEARTLLNQYVMKQAIDGVMYLRDTGAVHYDLKEVNVFMTSEGKVKVADFGGLQVTDKSHQQAKMTEGAPSTLGYVDPEKARYNMGGTKSDTHAIGKMMHMMQTGDSGAWMTDSAQEISGTLERVTDKMTGHSSQRPTLEAVLKSSYFQNLNPDREEDTQELLKAVLAYGKQIESQKLSSLHEGVQEWEINYQEYLKAEGPSSPNTKQCKIEFDKAKLAYDNHLKKHENDPVAKQLNERIRELSDRLTHPSDNLSEKPGEALGNFLSSLQSTVADAPRFWNFVTLPANSRFFEYLGVKFQDVVAAAKVHELDLEASRAKIPSTSTKASFVSDALQEARRAIDKLLNSVADPSFKKTLSAGFKNLITAVGERYKQLYPTEAGRVSLLANGLDAGGLNPNVKVNGEDGSVTVAVDVAPVAYPATTNLVDQLLDLAPIEGKFTVTLTPGSQDPTVFGSLLQSTAARFAKLYNAKLGALVTDVKKWRESAKQGQAHTEDAIKDLVEHANKAFTTLFNDARTQLQKGAEAAGGSKVAVGDTAFKLTGANAVSVFVPPPPKPHPEIEKYKQLSHGPLRVGPLLKLLNGMPPLTWLVYEDPKSGKFVVRWINNENKPVSQLVDDYDKQPLSSYQSKLGTYLKAMPKLTDEEVFAKYSHGKMAPEKAVEFLKSHPVRSWLIRESASSGGYAYSYRQSEEKVLHGNSKTVNFDWKWDEIEGRLDIRYLIEPAK